jgi:hypothetical protein
MPLVASEGAKHEEHRVKSKCMFMFYEQNAGKNNKVKASYKSLKCNYKCNKRIKFTLTNKLRGA